MEKNNKPTRPVWAEVNLDNIKVGQTIDEKVRI
jgi:hypothetical protein